MPPRPRRAAATAAAARTMRETSSPLSDEPPPPARVTKRRARSPTSESESPEPEPKKRATAKATSKAPAKATAKAPAKAPATAKARATATVKTPAKAPAKAAAKTPAKGKWPPAGLEPESHLERQGYPVYKFPTRPSKFNGGLNPDAAFSGPLLLGAHTSISGGPAGALLRASKAGMNGLALFMKGARQWTAKEFEPETIARFKDLMKSKSEGESILVHGNYLINLGNPDTMKWDNAYSCFRDDIHRCHQLGIKLYNWHPGSTVGACTKEESYALVAKAINRVHEDVPEVITVIENMANAGSNILGTTFHDLAAMIKLVDDKSRVRVCLDTCHLFAAGYDLRTPEAYADTMKQFADEVGNEFLGGIHLNDSKAGLGGNKDLHENIGLGNIGLSGFRCLMRDPLMAGIPIVLETPTGPGKDVETGEQKVWTKEIALLYEIQRIPDDEWEEKRPAIEARWRMERDAIIPPQPAGKAKPKPKPKPKGRGKKAESESEESEESDDE